MTATATAAPARAPTVPLSAFSWAPPADLAAVAVSCPWCGGFCEIGLDADRMCVVRLYDGTWRCWRCSREGRAVLAGELVRLDSARRYSRSPKVLTPWQAPPACRGLARPGQG